MAVFCRDEASDRGTRPSGLKCSSPSNKTQKMNPAIPPSQVLSRDDILDQNIRSMQQANDNGVNGGVMRFMTDSEPKSARGRNVHAKPDNDIFGPPVEAPKPRPRVRPGVSDAELQRIWQDDEKKVQAAQAMERAPNMVDRMATEPVSPMAAGRRTKDAQPASRKQINLSDSTQQRNRQQFEPAGFAGMGAHCATTGKTGIGRKPSAEFVAPEFVPKNMDGGRRTRATPKDTFSFNDDAVPVTSGRRPL